ncbi:Ankyrin repeat protein [Pyrobaculum oguniense TE7]|uniref:Ankyrin repeat protein n=1 Tax=Pyrobaculum oguniense (strain DSM 13380 / JCM 10595 / TE7) TaxID=698757 RepID=H6QCW6_PYROT|nr:Ankyrin repeat protein [Pyrobaculum oguniense TE7]
MSSPVIELKKLVIKNDVIALKINPGLSQYAGVLLGDRTALQLAVILDRREIVELLLQNNKELLNWADWRKKEELKALEAFGIDVPYETPLHTASRFCRPEIAELLLQYGADPNARDRDGFTPLHIATIHKCASVVELLLRHGADPHAVDGNNKRPYDAVQTPQLAYLYLRHGISSGYLRTLVAKHLCYEFVPEYLDVLSPDDLDFCVNREFLQRVLQYRRYDIAIITATRLGDVATVERILAERPELASVAFRYVDTPEMLEVVLKFYKPSDEDLQWLFEIAVEYDRQELAIYLLLNLNIRVDCYHLKNAKSVRVLEEILKRSGRLECYGLISSHIAVPGKLEVLARYYEFTADDLCYALEMGYAQSARIIAKHVVFVTPKHIDCICEYFDEEVLKILLERGLLDPNARCGKTLLLHEAAWHCARGLVDVLLRNGADVTATDAYGRFAPEVACREVADLFARL